MSPFGPGGPAGPVMFQETRVSLLWHAVLESTRRRLPLPGLTQASSVSGLLAACSAIGTTTAHARTEMQAMTLRRVNLMLMLFSLFELIFFGGNNLFLASKTVKRIAEYEDYAEG